MRRFAVFAYDRYYPSGGMADFQGSFDTREEAEDMAKGLNYDYKQIEDMEDMEDYK